MNFELRKYKSVAAFTTDISGDYVPTSGEQLFLTDLGGDSGSESFCTVSITWDAGGAGEEILFATHLSSVQQTTKMLTGDGVKKLRISLDNQTAVAKVMGGFCLGEKYGG